MKKMLAILLCMAMITGMLAGCGKTDSSDAGNNTPKEVEQEAEGSTELVELRVAVIPVLSSLPIQYMIDQGWDVENGFKIEKVVFSSGAPMGEALVSDLWDIGIMSAAGVFAAANYDAMCIADTSDSLGERGVGIFARPDSDIVQVKGANPTYPELYGDADVVKGKTILCPAGTISQMHVFKWLEKIGLTPADVNIVHMEFAQAYQAFLSGQGDLAALNPPFCFEILSEGMIDVAPIEALDVKLHDMVFANKKTFDEKQDVIQKCIELIYRAGEELEADAGKKAEALKNWYQINGSEVTDETIELEIKKKLFTEADIEVMDVKVGETLIELSEFFAEIGNIESEKLPIIEENVNDQVVNDLLK